MENNFYAQQQPINNGMYYGYPNAYNAQMYTYTQQQMPVAKQNALTPEEIQRLRSNAKAPIFDLTISEMDALAAFCTHKDGTADVVQILQDGSNKVFCPICQESWDPTQYSYEEVQQAVDVIISMMQNAKWTGEFPVNMTREYFTMIPLLKKFPELYRYAADRMNRMYGLQGYQPAGDVNVLSQYNSLFGSMGYNAYQPQMMYGQQQPMQGGYYAQQPAQMAGQPAMANPGVNPMQQPVYGAPGFNPQFANQNQMMMGGTYYAQPGQMQQPVFTPAQPQQTAAAPQATAQAPQQVAVSEVKTDL